MDLKLKALQTSKTSETIYQLSWRNTTEDLNLQGNTDLLYRTFVPQGWAMKREKSKGRLGSL